MGKAKFELNLKGLNELMKSPEMQDQLEIAGQAVVGVADGNYGVDIHVADFVAIASIYPADKESARKNARNNELVKALGAAGLPMG